MIAVKNTAAATLKLPFCDHFNKLYFAARLTACSVMNRMLK
jgi:hypothetical protein